MRHVDVAIAGGGLAGATAAAMLARAGLDVALVDTHPVYPFDFRSEKFSGPQVHLLRRTGHADAVLPAATAIDELWIARFGRLSERRHSGPLSVQVQGAPFRGPPYGPCPCCCLPGEPALIRAALEDYKPRASSATPKTRIPSVATMAPRKPVSGVV